MEKTKILFTHNTAMWYRLPFFKQLAKIYDLDLVFTQEGIEYLIKYLECQAI